MVLEFVKSHLQFLGIFQLENNSQNAFSYAYFRNMLVFISLSIFTIPTCVFFFIEALTFADYVNSFFFTICGFLGISFNTVLLLEKRNISQIIIDFWKIIKQRRQESASLRTLYDEADMMIESRTKLIHIIMLRVSVPVIVLQSILLSFIQYFQTDFSNDSFQLIYPYFIPFDWRSPFGYAAVLIFQLIGIISCSEVCVIVLCLFMGLCLVITTFVSDIETNLNYLNELLLTAAKSTELKKCLFDFIVFHEKTQALTAIFEKTFRKIIVCYFTYATISISSLLLCINGLRSLEAIQSIACLNVVMMWLFIYCYFGDEIINRFRNIEYYIYVSNWYLLPINLQKCIPMIISSSQKSIHLRGFGSMTCSCETFKTIVNASYSYFTMLRQVRN